MKSKINKIKKILFTSPFELLQWKELGLSYIIEMAAICWLVILFYTVEQNSWGMINNTIFLYIVLFLISSRFLTYRLAKKQAKANLLIACICIVLITIQNGIIIYLYSTQIAVSKSNLFIAILFSLLTIFICVEIWIRISAKNKKQIQEK